MLIYNEIDPAADRITHHLTRAPRPFKHPTGEEMFANSATLNTVLLVIFAIRITRMVHIKDRSGDSGLEPSLYDIAPTV